MPLFGKKKEEPQPIPEKTEEFKLPKAEELAKDIDISIPEEPEVKTEKVRESRKEFPPLFVKLERYEEILNTLNEVKNTLNSLKNSFFILNESERIRTETIELIKESIDKVERRVVALDEVLLKPPGYEEMPQTEEFKTDEMRDVLSTLRLQIDQLKQELESLP
jgi:small-conductance mechanosensitive channel